MSNNHIQNRVEIYKYIYMKIVLWKVKKTLPNIRFLALEQMARFNPLFIIFESFHQIFSSTAHYSGSIMPVLLSPNASKWTIILNQSATLIIYLADQESRVVFSIMMLVHKELGWYCARIYISSRTYRASAYLAKITVSSEWITWSYR